MFTGKQLIAGMTAVLLLGQIFTFPGNAEGVKLQDQVTQVVSEQTDDTAKTSYRQYIEEWSQKGKDDYSGEAIRLPATSANDVDFLKTTTQEKETVLEWKSTRERLDWKVNISQDGFYTVKISFCALGGNGGDIKRALLIDGASPFEEAENFLLTRVYRDSGKPRVNVAGDEVSPTLEEIFCRQEQAVYDIEGLYPTPLKFFLSAGEHVLTLEYIQEDIYLEAVVLEAPLKISDYAEVSKTYRAEDKKAAEQNAAIHFEAEQNTTDKTQSTLAMISDSDPAMTPQKYGYTVMNAMGGTYWNTANDSITWEFKVKKAGLYKLNLRLYQHYLDGLPIHRQIAIDGEVPFTEFLEYQIQDDKRWRNETLSDEDGNPYLLYLSEGTHTLTMTVKLGQSANGTLMKMLEDASASLSDLILDIRMIIGNNPDTLYDYRLEQKIPTLLEDLEGLIQAMEACTELALTLNDTRPMICNQFDQIASRLRAMADDPYTIPSNMEDLTTALTNFGTWIAGLANQPLAVDYIEFLAPEAEPVIRKATFFDQLASAWISFIKSFSKDYSSVGGMTENAEITEQLSVWIGRGSTYAKELKNLSDDSFTPETGINVSVHMLPAGQLNSGSVNALMLAVSSGDAPDVCLGVSAESPGEFAIRNALADLTQFPDYSDVTPRFYSEMLVPFTYQGKVYALPETMTFQVMMYRTDVFKKLGLAVPDTWEDVYSKMLPILNQNKLQFYVFTNTVYSTFDMFLYQHGGTYYNEEYTESALDSPEAYAAMKEYCDLFTTWGMPTAADLYNRMRTGEMPVGIGDYTVYLKLLTAAQELSGKWAIAPVPGLKKEDGTIDRSIGACVSESCMIMQQSDKKKEAWEFLKWWTDAEIQSRYARTIEGIYGRSARWPTATVEAFDSLSWRKGDLKVIKESLSHIKAQPIVLGSYYTTRHVTNAWNRVVVSKSQSVRDSLEDTVKAIDKELKRRREQYKE